MWKHVRTTSTSRKKKKMCGGGGEMDMRFLVLQGANADDILIAFIGAAAGGMGSSARSHHSIFRNLKYCNLVSR